MAEGPAPTNGRRDGRHNRDFETLHYELAAEVKALREQLQDAKDATFSLTTEVRTPKPAQWGVFATVAGTAVGIMLSIGGLIHSNLIQRIDNIRSEFEHADKMISDRISEMDARHIRREDEIKSTVVTRAEHAARDNALPPYVSKAEFDAAMAAINARFLRNEGYIEEARKGEALNNRINQLYELYRQLQQQQLNLHGLPKP